jgi:hypothetical protein
MKKSVLVFFVTLFFFSFMAKGQDCVSYFPTRKGKVLMYQYYDAKHKPSTKMYYDVKDVQQTADGEKISIEQWFETPEGDVVDTFLLDYYCKNGEFYIDMKSSLIGVLDKYEGMDIEVSSHDLALPAKMNVGDMLPDGAVTAVVKNNGIKMMTITSEVHNRKVEAKEKVTTPAGTFDCVKVTFDTDGKVGFMKTHAKGAVWYAKGIGTVKSENYNKKGKLEDSVELVEVK